MTTPKHRAKQPKAPDPDSPDQFYRVRWYARRSSPRAIRKLVSILTTGTTSEQLRAAQMLLQFSWGTPVNEIRPGTESNVQLPVDAQIKYLEQALAKLKGQ